MPKAMAEAQHSYAHLRLALHPVSAPVPEGEIRLGDIRIELESMRVTVAERLVTLTVQEFDLLVLLAREADKPVTQAELAAGLWQVEKPQHKRHLSVLIARLRSKLAGSRTYRLETLRKRGYALMPPLSKRIEEIKRIRDGLDFR
jgi:DNA-binding response OmpR family regulator